MEATISTSQYTFSDVSQWLERVEFTYGRLKLAGWEFVLTLQKGIDQFGRTDPAKMELYELASQQVGLSVNTLQNYVSTARKPSTVYAVELGLQLGHAQAVIGLEDVVAESVLLEAAENGMSVELTRRLAWQYKTSNLDIQTKPTTTKIAEPKPLPHVAHNSGENEWYTPREYIEAARLVMGCIDVDPASSGQANAIIKASLYHTVADSGLLHDWHGRVWLNPPYATPLIGQFITHLVRQVKRGNVIEAIVLVNNATETQWFRDLISVAAAVCFPTGRVRFWGPNGATGAPLQGQAVVYVGERAPVFLSTFGGFGWGVQM